MPNYYFIESFFFTVRISVHELSIPDAIWSLCARKWYWDKKNPLWILYGLTKDKRLPQIQTSLLHKRNSHPSFKYEVKQIIESHRTLIQTTGFWNDAYVNEYIWNLSCYYCAGALVLIESWSHFTNIGIKQIE